MLRGSSAAFIDTNSLALCIAAWALIWALLFCRALPYQVIKGPELLEYGCRECPRIKLQWTTTKRKALLLLGAEYPALNPKTLNR